MTFFSPQSLLRHTGGRFLRRPADDAGRSQPQSTDQTPASDDTGANTSETQQ